MKKMAKVLAIVLVVCMTLTVFAIPAAASTDQTNSPRVIMGSCQYCVGNNITFLGYRSYLGGIEEDYEPPNYMYKVERVYYCNDCLKEYYEFDHWERRYN